MSLSLSLCWSTSFAPTTHQLSDTDSDQREFGDPRLGGRRLEAAGLEIEEDEGLNPGFWRQSSAASGGVDTARGLELLIVVVAQLGRRHCRRRGHLFVLLVKQEVQDSTPRLVGN